MRTHGLENRLQRLDKAIVPATAALSEADYWQVVSTLTRQQLTVYVDGTLSEEMRREQLAQLNEQLAAVEDTNPGAARCAAKQATGAREVLVQRLARLRPCAD